MNITEDIELIDVEKKEIENIEKYNQEQIKKESLGYHFISGTLNRIITPTGKAGGPVKYPMKVLDVTQDIFGKDGVLVGKEEKYYSYYLAVSKYASQLPEDFKTDFVEEIKKQVGPENYEKWLKDLNGDVKISFKNLYVNFNCRTKEKAFYIGKDGKIICYGNALPTRFTKDGGVTVSGVIFTYDNGKNIA